MDSHIQGCFARKTLLIVTAAIGIVLCPRKIDAQQLSQRPDQDRKAYAVALEGADRKIADAEKAGSEALQNEEYLSTFIGPRLTGSPGMQKASQWTLELFRKYGLDSHLETIQIPHSWDRGNDWGELISPVQHWMSVRSAAWGKATPGPVMGRLVAIERTTNPYDIVAHRDKYKGAIVFFAAPPRRATLRANPPNSYDAVVTAQQAALLKLPLKELMAMFGSEDKQMEAIVQAGAAAMLRDSEQPYALLHMGSAAGGFKASPLPIAYVSHPDYEWLQRVAKAGEATFRINLEGRFSDGPGSTSNTVAQIKGSEHPEEQVLIGAHLDSWDLGEGAVDDGTGVAGVLEAARLLKSLGWKPKRTLTFVLFFGEEQGVAGSREFVKQHAKEIDKIDAVLIDDVGTGRITSIPVENLWSAAPLMDEIYGPLQKVFDLDPMTNEYFSGADHIPFMWAGIPAYLAVQAPAEYGYAHHSNYDVFELVDPEGLKQQAAVLAAWMWNVSEMPGLLPHHSKEAGAE